MLKKILIAVVAIVAIFLVVAALQSNDFRVTRSATITAPPAVVFAQVNDLHKWQEWSPWAKLDPSAKITFEGPVNGPGAAFSWAGNGKVGEGRMAIVDARPSELVRFKLDFVKPFAGTNMADFTFQPQGDQTVVTWSMYGPKNFISKAFGLIVDCDKMVGGDFEKGLVSLKAQSEAAAAANSVVPAEKSLTSTAP